MRTVLRCYKLREIERQPLLTRIFHKKGQTSSKSLIE